MPLSDYAHSENQKRIADTAEANPGWNSYRLAEHLGLGRGTVTSALSRMRKRRAKKDPAHHSNVAPEGYRLRGVSTLRHDPEGNLQWVKTELTPPHKDPQAFLKVFTQALERTDLVPANATAPPQGSAKEDLLAVYPLGDPHLGMIASGLLSNTEYNLEKSVADLYGAVDELVHTAPPAQHALVLNVGDYFHADDMTGQTSRSKNKLDVDPRWHLVFQTGIETMIRLIYRALEKHERVTVDNRPGNHDDQSAAMLQMCLAAYFRNEPRVDVVQDVHSVWRMVHGRVMIATTHGHAPKPEHLPGILAADYPEDWGRTKIRHAYVGHVHHQVVKDYPGVTVESLRVHGAQDAWHHGQGYRSKRGVLMDVWHKEEGHKARHMVNL